MNYYEIVFIVKTGWKFYDVTLQKATLTTLDNTKDFENIYYLEGESSYRDSESNRIIIIYEAISYYESPVKERKLYLELGMDLSHLYQGENWFEIKKTYEKI